MDCLHFLLFFHNCSLFLALKMASNRQRPQEFEEYVAPSASDKLLRRSKENPAFPIGIGAGACVLGYMAYSWRTSKEKLSVYLIHTRLGVQGSVVGALTVAMGYQIYW